MRIVVVAVVCKRRCKDGRVAESTQAMRNTTPLAVEAIAKAQAV